MSNAIPSFNKHKCFCPTSGDLWDFLILTFHLNKSPHPTQKSALPLVFPI